MDGPPRVWASLVEPDPDAPPAQRRQLRLLLTMTVVLAALVVLVEVATLLRDHPSSPFILPDLSTATVGTFAGLVVVYVVGRVGHLEVGSVGLVLVMTVGILSSVPGLPPGIVPVVLAFLVVPLYLGSLLLPGRYLAVLVAIVLATVLWPSIRIQEDARFALLVLVGLTGALLTVGATVRDRDLAALETAALELQESRDRFRLLFERTPAAIFLSTPEGRVVDANPALAGLFGYDDPDAMIQGVEDAHRLYADPGDRRRWVARVREGGQVGGFKTRFRRRDGSTFPAELHAARLRPAGDGAGLLLGTVVDLTVQKRLEGERARREGDLARQAELDQLIFVSSHNLQEPLRDIGRFAQKLERDLGEDGDPSIREDVAFIVGGVQRLQAVVNGLLAYAEATVGGQSPGDVESSRALGEAAENLGYLPDDVELQVDWGDLPRVRADPGQLVVLFRNLLDNAVKFRDGTSTTVHVQVDADVADGIAAFRVEDDGPGIPAEQRERVLRLFSRLHGRDVPGLGVGLTVARRIVERHGGELRIDAADGGGASVRFTLPVAGEVPPRANG